MYSTKNHTNPPGTRLLVAHRGYSLVCPENTLPSFGAAIAAGADEIEFDLWPTCDGELVVCHDPTVDRTSNGKGRISSLTWEEISRLDAGAWKGEGWRGVKFCRFDDVLELFANRIKMNIHVKSELDIGKPISESTIRKIVNLIEAYKCKNAVYISGDVDVLEVAGKVAPDIVRNCLGGLNPMNIVMNAIKYKCKRLQFFKPYFNKDMIDEAHAAGIFCNIYFADDEKEAQEYLELGIDAILSNATGAILPITRQYPAERQAP
ncbi:MAG TPA: hypothetical protein GXX20_05570 [Clostridiaceae bacterium]|nr:hypothetical protein [Clostridiaceae bacterium]